MTNTATATVTVVAVTYSVRFQPSTATRLEPRWAVTDNVRSVTRYVTHKWDGTTDSAIDIVAHSGLNDQANGRLIYSGEHKGTRFVTSVITF